MQNRFEPFSPMNVVENRLLEIILSRNIIDLWVSFDSSDDMKRKRYAQMNLATLRRQKFGDLPRKVFARDLGISEGYLGRIENRRRVPSKTIVLRMAKLYRESVFLIRSLLAKENVR